MRHTFRRPLGFLSHTWRFSFRSVWWHFVFPFIFGCWLYCIFSALPIFPRASVPFFFSLAQSFLINGWFSLVHLYGFCLLVSFPIGIHSSITSFKLRANFSHFHSRDRFADKYWSKSIPRFQTPPHGMVISLLILVVSTFILGPHVPEIAHNMYTGTIVSS